MNFEEKVESSKFLPPICLISSSFRRTEVSSNPLLGEFLHRESDSRNSSMGLNTARWGLTTTQQRQ